MRGAPFGERRIGRAAFLSVVGSAGWAARRRPASPAASRGPLGAAGGVVPQGLKDILPIGGWRIYAINPPWPEFHPAHYRLEVDGHVRHPVSLAWDDLMSLPTAGRPRTSTA